MNKLNLSAGAALLLVMSSAAWALDCPVLSAIDDPAVSASMDQFLPADTDLDAPDALPSAVFELRRAGVPDDLILDHLIAVYCNSVATAQEVSDDEGTRRIEAFSQTATQAVFGDID